MYTQSTQYFSRYSMGWMKGRWCTCHSPSTTHALWVWPPIWGTVRVHFVPATHPPHFCPIAAIGEKFIFKCLILGVSQNLWKCLCKTMSFRVMSKRYTAREPAFNFIPVDVLQCSFLVLSMDVLGTFLIPCRSQWRTDNSQVRTVHVEHQMENMVPPKSGDAVLGTLRDR